MPTFSRQLQEAMGGDAITVNVSDASPEHVHAILAATPGDYSDGYSGRSQWMWFHTSYGTFLACYPTGDLWTREMSIEATGDGW